MKYYSQRREKYVKNLRIIIHANKLTDFDQVKLVTENIDATKPLVEFIPDLVSSTDFLK